MAEDFDQAREQHEQTLQEREEEYQAILADRKAQAQNESEERKKKYLKELALKQARQELSKRAGRAVAKGGKAGARAAATGARVIASAVAVLWEAFLAALPAILVILGVLGVLLIIIATIAVICNAEGLNGTLARVGSSAASVIIGTDYCEAFTGLTGGVATFLDQSGSRICSSTQVLASQNNTPFPRRNDPDLDKLVSCIQGRVTDVGSVFTFENENEACNYVRGAETCGACAHAQNSCHYGGRSGSTGSQAVDFGNEQKGRQILEAGQVCRASLGLTQFKRATCENSTGTPVACTDPSATHVHISLGTCDSDNSGPINTQ